MKNHRIFIEIVTLASAVATGLALLIAFLGVVAEAGQAATEVPTYEGMVTCSSCGAKHSSASGKSAAECARLCVRDGANFALVDGDRSYLLDVQPDVIRSFIGQRARISGGARVDKIRVVTVVKANP